MKKYIIIALSLFFLGTLNAQTLYDGADLSNKGLSGTARFVGMGGAMGALGGDISTIGSNPAGIGIYRSNDVMTSVSFSTHEIETKYDGNKFSNTRNRAHFDNFGIVFSNNMGRYNTLRFVNFAFNYNRAKTFYRTREMSGLMGGSQIDQMITQANDAHDKGYDLVEFGDDGYNLFDVNGIGWLSAIGYEGFLFDPVDGGFGAHWTGKPQGHFYSKESGGINQYDFNLSFNLIDRVYLGLSIGAYDVDYKKYSFYVENLYHADTSTSDENYDLHSNKWIDGAGFDFKFGLIVRPFEESPFRFGVAVHTPTFYKLTLGAESMLSSTIYLVNNQNQEVLENKTVYTSDGLGRMEKDYRLRTPWKFNLSLGHTIGSQLALGAEYEYQDNSSINFKHPSGGGPMDHETNVASEFLKGVHTLRLGAEYNIIPQFAFRVGYNYSTTGFEKGAFKDLATNAIETDTDYANEEALNRFTLGFGYRGKSLYGDLGYQFNHYKEKFYTFDHKDLQSASTTNSKSQVVMTVGVRF